MLAPSQLASSIDSLAPRQTSIGARDRLAFIFDESPLAVIAVSMRGQIEYVNPVMRARTGYQPGEMVGRDAAMLHPRYGAADRQVRHVLASGEPWSGRIWGKTKDGEVHWIHADLSPLRDVDGRVTCCVAVCRELSPLQRSEQQTSPRVPGNAQPTFVMVSDLEGIIQFESGRVSGLEHEDVIHTSLFHFVPPDQHDRVRAHMEKVIATGASTMYETAAVGPDGDESRYVTKIGPITNGDVVVALSFIAYDITHGVDTPTGAPPSAAEFEEPRGRVATGRTGSDGVADAVVLSKREREVLELLARGLTNREAARRLRLSARTIDHHVGHILRKLDVPNRTAAALAARRRGLLARQIHD